MSTMLRITQVGSPIGRTRDQRSTVRSLGLRRIRHTVIQPDRPEIRGMLRKVAHLVTFAELSAADAEAFAAAAEASRAPGSAPTGPRAKEIARATARAKGRTPAKASTPAVKSTSGADDATEASAEPAAEKAPAKKAPAKKSTTKKSEG